MTIYIKNTDTNEVLTLEVDSYDQLSKNFRTAPYEKATDSEKDAFLLQEAKSEKIEQVRVATEDLILSSYSKTDQINILMSGDGLKISSMNSVIEPILAKSRTIRARILSDGCNTITKLNKINTDL